METHAKGQSRPPAAVPGDLFTRTAEIAAGWLASLSKRPVAAPATVGELRSLGGPLPRTPADPLEVVEDLARAVEPGLVGIPSGRYFGFVIGGGLPAAVAADWLTSVWDQCPGFYACGPAASVAEEAPLKRSGTPSSPITLRDRPPGPDVSPAADRPRTPARLEQCWGWR